MIRMGLEAAATSSYKLGIDVCEVPLMAPAKRWAIIPGGGHNAILLMPDAFLATLKANLPALLRTD
jgi:hypothetical protein